jgi:catechol 2,3-dioxygenase-like lactoylglutathione lyase family enzyme
MKADRFDHVFVEPTSFDASVAFYRDALGWRQRFAWGARCFVARDRGGNLIAIEQRA